MTDETAEPLQHAPHAGGRPSLYRPEYAEQAFKLCLRGATDRDLADFFEVCEATINNWKLNNPDFVAQLRAGKTEADMHIANSLYNRAEGAEWTEEVAIKVKIEHFENGKKVRTEEKIETVPVRKRAAPDTTAIIFWLKNRDRRNWRDKQDVEVSGKDGGPIPTATAVVTGDELKAMIKQAEQDV